MKVIKKVDLVMWTKNGERFLPQVLKRIDEVIPHEVIHKKILVDDHSVDKTIYIAKDFNWEAYLNPKSGIASGANEALRHVECEFFVSVEQDVVLAKNWWQKIPQYMENESIAVAQGIRLSVEPTLRKLDEYVYNRIKGTNPLRFGVSMDNNIFRTKVIREIGGFPNICPVCTDTVLMKKIMLETPYRWVIDRTIISDHIRPSISYYLKHKYDLTTRCAHSKYCVPHGPHGQMLLLFLFSPVRAFHIAYKKECPKILWVYPMIRYQKLKGYIDRRRAPKPRSKHY